MKKHLQLLCFCLICNIGEAQISEADSVKIQVLIDQIKQYGIDTKLDSSLLIGQKARSLAIELGSERQELSAGIAMMQALYFQYRFEECRELVSEIRPRIIARSKSDKLLLSDFFYQLGTMKTLSGELDSGTYFLDQTIKIRHGRIDEESLSILSGCYNNIGYIQHQLGNVQKGIESLRKGYEIDTMLYGQEHIYSAMDLANIGAIYNSKSYYAISLDYLLQALKSLRAINNKSMTYSNVLSNIGRAYSRTGEFEKGYNYQRQALRNNIQLFGEDHIDHFSIYEALGRNFFEQELYDSSLYYYKKVLKNENELVDINVSTLLFAMRSASLCYAYLGDFESAYSQIKKTIEIAKEKSLSPDLIATFQNDYGLIAAANNEYEMAMKLFKSSLQPILGGGNLLNVTAIKTFQNIAELQIKLGDYSDALKSIKTGIELNRTGVRDFVSLEDQLIMIQLKAKALRLQYEKLKGTTLLENLTTTYDTLVGLIKHVHIPATSTEDKIYLLQKAQKVYEEAISINYEAFKIFDEETYLHKCFHISELNKSALLLEVLNTERDDKWSSIPSSLLLEKERILTDEASYKTILNDIKKTGSDSTKISDVESRLFHLRIQLDSVLTKIEMDHPKYHQLKYSRSEIPVPQIMEELNPDEVFIEYFQSDSTTYAFVITHQKFDMLELSSKQKIDSAVGKFLESLDEASLNASDGFAKESYILYKLVFDPIAQLLKEDKFKELIIVPNGKLNHIPFDLLIEEEPFSSVNFLALPYLLNKYSIHYSFAAFTEYELKTNSPGTKKFIGLAPTYTFDSKANANLLLSSGREITSLKWNQAEIENIIKIYAGTTAYGEFATELFFKTEAKNYDIIHLAMHAIVDDNNPMNSKFLFASNGDNIEDGMLHTFELFSLRLNASLAVLSACQTGAGTNIEGDGVMSLARGFAYAGVPSIVMSHWNVDDQATSVLMTDFYKFLSEGDSKSKALQKAKLGYLQKASPNKVHPFFWGSFVVLGDDSPIESYNNWIIYLSIAGISIILIFFKRKDSFLKRLNIL